MPHGFIEKVGRCVPQYHAPVGEVDSVRFQTAISVEVKSL